MTETPEPKSDFKLVLNGVPAESVQAVAQELTSLFPLDLPNAANIAKNTPLILLDKLTPQQARSVGTYAIRLKALGADVQVTSQPVGKLQVLRWPVMPDITRRPGNHVICPRCGARLQVQVHVPGAGRAAAPAPEAPPAPAPAPPPPPVPQAAPPPPPVEEPEPVTEEEPDEVILEPVVEDEDLLELSDDEVVLEEAPASGQPGPPVGGEGSCRVTLVGKIRGKKKTQAAELMSYYLGIAREEAVLQLGKTVVTVGKDLTAEQAETCKSQFADIGVKVKIKG